MIKNVCKKKECRGWDSDYPNNCLFMVEISRCRQLEKVRLKQMVKQEKTQLAKMYDALWKES